MRRGGGRRAGGCARAAVAVSVWAVLLWGWGGLCRGYDFPRTRQPPRKEKAPSFHAVRGRIYHLAKKKDFPRGHARAL